MNHWLLKSEPASFGIDDLAKAPRRTTTWDGVRNHRAANNLRAMKKGDKAFFYHSNIGLEIVGIVTISKSGIADPSDSEGKWAAVKVKPVKKLRRPVTLKEIKADPALDDMELVRQSRLSVAEVRPVEWEHILAMSKG